MDSVRMWRTGIWKFRKTITFVLLASISIVIILAKLENTIFIHAVKQAVVPFHKIGTSLSSSFFSSYRNIQNYLHLREENKSLQEKVEQLKSQNLELREKLNELGRLKLLEELKNNLKFKTVTANIISYDPKNYINSCTIDIGTADAAANGNVLINKDGIVGRIVSCLPVTSAVLFITDPNCRIAAIIERNRSRGIVVGSGGKICNMKYLSIEDDVRVGDSVISSGEGGIIPKGFTIGRVTKVEVDKDGISLLIEIAPAVKLSQIEEVLVILSKKNQ